MHIHINKAGRSSKPLTSDYIRVRAPSGGPWQPLVSWPLTLKMDFGTGLEGYRQQTYWWNLLPLSFRFMDLPTELQAKIVSFAIDDKYRVYYDWRVPHYSSWLNYSLDKAIRYIPYEVSSLALLHVCPYLAYTTLKEVSTYSWKCFTDSFASEINPRVQWYHHVGLPDWLNKIELCFSYRKYFTFFGVSINLVQGILIRNTNYTNTGSLLRGLPQQKQLSLRFERGTHPSSGTIDILGEGPCPPCQSVLIKWIMVLAYDEIKHFSKVTLTGDIPTYKKSEWIQLLSSEDWRQAYDAVSAQHQAAILNSPSRLV